MRSGLSWVLSADRFDTLAFRTGDYGRRGSSTSRRVGGSLDTGAAPHRKSPPSRRRGSRRPPAFLAVGGLLADSRARTGAQPWHQFRHEASPPGAWEPTACETDRRGGGMRHALGKLPRSARTHLGAARRARTPYPFSILP